jgi:hypothetical protein
MLKPLVIILFGLFLFSFTDGIDQFDVFLNQKHIGHWDENDYGQDPKTFWMKPDYDKDTLRFVFGTDSGEEDDSKIEFRDMNDSIINVPPTIYWQNRMGTFIFPLAHIKNIIESHKQIKVSVRVKYYGQIDTAHTYQHIQLMGILKFN